MIESDFRSDTVTRPTEAMRAAMAAAPVGDDVFGDDPTINALQEEAAELLGFEAALFTPSGTQSNLIALMSQCNRGDEVILGQLSHTYRWEGGGMAVLGSIQPQPIEHDEDGTLPLRKIWAAIKPDDPHFARTSMLALENTIGGRALPLSYLADARALARQAALRLHLDGARLFNAAAEIASLAADDSGNSGLDDSEQRVPDIVSANKLTRAEARLDGSGAVVQAARQICDGFDTVSVCLSKGLGCPVGSLLLGTGQTINQARRIRKMLGGGMRQAGVLAAAGRHALTHHLARLKEDHALARRLAAGIREVVEHHPGLQGRARVLPAQTNMVFVELDDDVGPSLTLHLQDAGVRITGGLFAGAYRQRWVTHLDVGDRDVDRALEALHAFRLAA